MRILITGTSGDIGAAVCSAARKRGHEILEINRADWAILAERVRDESAFDAVVFCTGTSPVRPAALLSDEAFLETFQVNCWLFLRLMRTLLVEKRYSKEGMRVLAISSVSATEGWAGGAAYCASKAALSGLCRALDVELKPKKIQVKAMEPRYIATKMFRACAGRMGVPESQAMAPELFAEEVLKEIGA